MTAAPHCYKADRTACLEEVRAADPLLPWEHRNTPWGRQWRDTGQQLLQKRAWYLSQLGAAGLKFAQEMQHMANNYHRHSGSETSATAIEAPLVRAARRGPQRVTGQREFF